MMRTCSWYRIAAAALALLGPPALATAMQARRADPPAVEAARRAQAILARAVAYAGGPDALAVTSIEIEEDAAIHNPLQGAMPVLSPEAATKPWDRRTVREVADLAGRRFSRHVTGLIYGGQPLDLRLVITPQAAFTLNGVTRVVNEQPAAGAAQAFLRQRARRADALLRLLRQDAAAARHAGQRAHRGGVAEIVTTTIDGSLVDVLFDPATGALLAQERVVRDDRLGLYVSSIEYADWQPVDGRPILRLPRRETVRAGGFLMQENAARVVRVNTMPDADLFAAPAQAVMPYVPRQGAQPLAPGLFVLEGRYNSLIAVGKDEVIVVEPGDSVAAAERVIAAVKTLAPGKPISTIVATHFHDDHIAGIRPYLAAGARIVSTPHALASTADLQQRAAPGAPQTPKTTPVGEGPVVLLAGTPQELRVLPIGPNPHADQMLIVHAPAARLVFEADLVDFGGVAPTAALWGSDSEAFYSALVKAGIQPDIIVPVHGRIGTWADVVRSREWRNGRRN